MLSYTGRRNLYGTLTNNTSSSNLTVGDGFMNNAEKRILALFQWPFLEVTDTKTTSAATQSYQIPQRIGKLEQITVTYNSVIYSPRQIASETQWQAFNQNAPTGDIPSYWYQREGKVYLGPTPVAGGATITFFGRRLAKDLTIADYTTGSIVSIANGATAVTGTGTSWTTNMAGMFIRITDGTAANAGDGYWYEIASVQSTTTLTLVKPYAGTSISAATAAYTIGQMSLLPSGYTELPVYDAARIFFASVQPNAGKFAVYDRLYKELESRLMQDYGTHVGEIVLGSELPDYS